MASEVGEDLLREPRQNKLAYAFAVAVVTIQVNLPFSARLLPDLNIQHFVAFPNFFDNVLFGDTFHAN